MYTYLKLYGYNMLIPFSFAIYYIYILGIISIYLILDKQFYCSFLLKTDYPSLGIPNTL